MKIIILFIFSILSFLSFGFDNLDYGIPTNNCFDIMIIDRPGYAVGYSKIHKQPLWASYRLTREEVIATNGVSRSDNFREDFGIAPRYRSTLNDYNKSGYDRGHIAPARDMVWSSRAMTDSFYLSNMSPQKPEFNRGIWKELESWVRGVAYYETSIVVVSGCLFNEATNSTIGINRVSIPSYYFKVILDETEPKKTIGFLLPNEGSTNSLSSFVFTVDEIEDVSGMDFFSELEYVVQTNIESMVDFKEWNSIYDYGKNMSRNGKIDKKLP